MALLSPHWLPKYRITNRVPTLAEVGVYEEQTDKHRDDWLEQRKGTSTCPVVTATDAAVLMGHGYQCKSSRDLYYEKKEPSQRFAADRLLLGSYMEEGILDVAEKKRLVRVIEKFRYQLHTRHITFKGGNGIIAASLDAGGVMFLPYTHPTRGLIVKVCQCVIEVKNAQNKFYWNISGSTTNRHFLTDGLELFIPKNTYVQVQVQMYCANVHNCALLVNYSGEITPIHVRYNQTFMAQVANRCKDFMFCCVHNIAPTEDHWEAVELPDDDKRGVSQKRLELPTEISNVSDLFYTDSEKVKNKSMTVLKQQIKKQVANLHDSDRNMLVQIHQAGMHIANAKYTKRGESYAISFAQAKKENK